MFHCGYFFILILWSWWSSRQRIMVAKNCRNLGARVRKWWAATQIWVARLSTPDCENFQFVILFRQNKCNHLLFRVLIFMQFFARKYLLSMTVLKRQ